MVQTYNVIKEHLEGINFGEIWPGFFLHRFALYDESSMCIDGKLFPRPECFRGNTAVEYEGVYIAIWKVDRMHPPEDMEILAADIVHEMFHAFQAEQGEKRFPDDLITFCYPEDAYNYTEKLQENQLLAKAYRERDIRKKRELLACFCRLRGCRSKKLGKFAEYEYLAETVEGMAEYAGTAALGMISPGKQKQRIKKYLQLLENLSPLLFDVRGISYYVGTILAMTAKEAGIPIEHSIGSEKESLYRVIADKPGLGHRDEEEETVPAKQASVEKAVRQMLDNHITGKKRRIEDFFAQDRRKAPGVYRICGYDPMNMYSAGGMVLGTHFFLLRDEKTDEIITLEGESVLEMTGEGNLASGYWR